MDPLRIALRVVFSYAVVLVLVRWVGKRTVRQAPAFHLTFSLVLADLVDSAIYAEVPLAQFAVAAGVLLACQISVDAVRLKIH
jgi:uncharacterized membrane protein YcaP (DUF421 family)